MFKYIITLLFVLPLTSLWAKSSDGIIIEAYGGSSTAGVIAVRKEGRLKNIISEGSEIKVLRRMLKEKYGDKVRVINKGQPSAQAIELLKGTRKYHKNDDWDTEMKKSPAKIVILNFATNDARHYHFNDASPDYVVSPEEYGEVMSALISIARNHGKAVIVQEPHPLCGRAKKWHVEPYNARLNQLARDLSVPLVRQYHRIRHIAGWESMMSPDCIHPSDALYKIKAENTFKVIANSFNTLLAEE